MTKVRNITCTALVVIIVSISLSGCNEATEVQSFSLSSTLSNSMVGEKQIDGHLECVAGNKYCSEWKDIETGVHYYYTPYGGLTVRTKPDGAPYVD